MQAPGEISQWQQGIFAIGTYMYETVSNRCLNLFGFLREEGITILIVEQNVQHALEVADKADVFKNGSIVADGKSRELLINEHVKKAYLGI